VSAAVEGLTDLFGELPAGLRVATWQKKDKRSVYLSDFEEAARFEGAQDVYVSAALVAVESAERIGSRGRPKARDAAAIPGVWADVDVNGTPDGGGGVKTGVAPDREAALELAFAVLEPTLLVNSGYGVQAWWLFEEPWVFGSDEERERAAQIVRGFHAVLRERATFGLDATHDLARLMRLAGTSNGKGEEPVPVEREEHDGPRYDLEALARVAQDAAPSRSSAKVAVSVDFPALKFEALRENSREFARTWDHERAEHPEWSDSEHDLSLASQAAHVGWTDEELAALIREHRQSRNGAGDGKALRQDYLERTVAKAREGVSPGTEQSPPVTYDVSTGKPLAALEHLSRLLGGVQVRRLVWRRSKRSAHVFTVLDPCTGEEREAKTVYDVLVLSNVQAALHAVTGKACEAPRRNSEKWRAIQDAITAAAEVVEVGDEEAEEWRFRLGRYLRDRVSMAPQEAAKFGEPFERDGRTYVSRPVFQEHLRMTARMRAETSEVTDGLHALGFEPDHGQNYLKDDGKRGNRSYWASPPGWTP